MSDGAEKWEQLLDDYAEALQQNDEAEAAAEVADVAANAARIRLGEVEDKLGRQFDEVKAAVRLRVRGEE